MKSTLMWFMISSFGGFTSRAQQISNTVHIVGQMKNVMWKGQLYGNIDLDTITNKANLYGIGPVEYLMGEVLIINGKSYQSIVISDTTMKVKETFAIKAPFFAYANITKWTEQTLPDSVATIQQLEQYLHKATTSSQGPFMFKVAGKIKYAKVHVVNLPVGSKVNSPDHAHKGQKDFELENERVEIVGFFSTVHKGIFTHHDTYLHMHLLTADLKSMGHLDEALFTMGTTKLFLPSK